MCKSAAITGTDWWLDVLAQSQQCIGLKLRAPLRIGDLLKDIV